MDQLVSFEVAKLAKQKGFDGFTRHGFKEDGTELSYSGGLTHGWGEPQGYYYYNMEEGRYARPTQTELQRWFRENYRLNVSTRYYEGKWKHYIQLMYEDRIKGYWGHEMDSYEAALESGLLEALKLIDNGK